VAISQLDVVLRDFSIAFLLHDLGAAFTPFTLELHFFPACPSHRGEVGAENMKMPHPQPSKICLLYNHRSEMAIQTGPPKHPIFLEAICRQIQDNPDMLNDRAKDERRV